MKFGTVDLTNMPKVRKCVKVKRKVINILDDNGNVIDEMVSYERIFKNLD